MLLNLSYSETVFPSHKIAEIGRLITTAFLDSHTVATNRVVAQNVTMKLQELPDGYTLIDGDIAAGVWLECTMPSFELATRSNRDSFFADATEILFRCAEGRVKRSQIYTNGVHTVNETWGLDGHTLPATELEDAIVQRSPDPADAGEVNIIGKLVESNTTKKPSPTLRDVINHPLYNSDRKGLRDNTTSPATRGIEGTKPFVKCKCSSLITPNGNNLRKKNPMPFVRIAIPAGESVSFKQNVGHAIHDAMFKTINIPEDDNSGSVRTWC